MNGTASPPEAVAVQAAPLPEAVKPMPTQHEGSSSRPSRRSLIVVVGVLVAVLLLVICIPAASQSWSATAELHPHPRIEVYTPAQAARAAKAAVAKLQQIEERRPLGLTTANPLALPKTKETDLAGERRR